MGEGAIRDLDPVPWWRDAVVYEVYLRSFAPLDGRHVPTDTALWFHDGRSPVVA